MSVSAAVCCVHAGCFESKFPILQKPSTDHACPLQGAAAAAGPAAGLGGASASQPQSEAHRRIRAVLDGWSEAWEAKELPKLEAKAHKCVLAF